MQYICRCIGGLAKWAGVKAGGFGGIAKWAGGMVGEIAKWVGGVPS